MKSVGWFLLGLGIGVAIGSLLTSILSDAEAVGELEKVPFKEPNQFPEEAEREALEEQYYEDINREMAREYEDYLAAYDRDEVVKNADADDISPIHKPHIASREEWRVSIISPDDYRIGEAGQVKEEFTYYSLDDIVTDSDGIPIDDLDVLGDGLGNFGIYGAPPDQVYIRNRELHMDVCVTKVNRSYQASVLGIPDEEDDDRILRFRALNE